MSPYNAITLRMPGRHSADTTPPGGDFVVCVDDEEMEWTQHQFTHTDIFTDLGNKNHGVLGKKNAYDLMRLYVDVVKGYAPPTDLATISNWEGTIHPQTFIYAVQCLAVAEHRRYARFENKFGGRYLPFRFGAGIVEGLWTVTDAVEKQRKGRPGVEQLEKLFGTPALTKELMNG